MCDFQMNNSHQSGYTNVAIHGHNDCINTFEPNMENFKTGNFEAKKIDGNKNKIAVCDMLIKTLTKFQLHSYMYLC